MYSINCNSAFKLFQIRITHRFFSFSLFFFVSFFSKKQTWTLKSDIISKVIYLQLTVASLLEKQQTDVSLAVMKKLQTDAEGHLSGEKYFMMIQCTVWCTCLCLFRVKLVCMRPGSLKIGMHMKFNIPIPQCGDA